MLFIDNKYTTAYFCIINRAKIRTLNGYSEEHHIIPKSIGGSNHSTNLVLLTAKEHFICHRLLTKMTFGEAKRKMTFAAWAMTMRNNNNKYDRISARTYSYLKEERAKLLRGTKVSETTLEKRRIARARQIITEETKQKISAALKGRTQSVETKLKRANSHKGRKDSEATKVKRAESLKLYYELNSIKNSTIEKIKEARAKQDMRQRIVTCPHCKKIGGHRNMARYHFDNCKYKDQHIVNTQS